MSVPALSAPRPGTFEWPASAAQTAYQVLVWAAGPGSVPPSGSLRAVGELPGNASAVHALQMLARALAARTGAGWPMLGDGEAIGPGALFLAAAIGGRLQPDLAGRLTALVVPPALNRTSRTGWADAFARHAVVEPALAAGTVVAGASTGPVQQPGLVAPGLAAALSRPLADSLLRASPLSAVLIRPADGQATLAADAALGLLARPRGTDVLATVLSPWHANAEVLSWRARLLSRLAASHPGAVLEVYAAARLCHGAEWDRQLSVAAAALRAAASSRPDERSLATVQFWAPMLVRQVQEQLPRRRLLSGYDGALGLIRQYGLQTVGGL